MTATTPAPVIGRRRAQAPRATFPLAVYRGEAEELWNFTVRAQMDTSSVFSLSADDVSAGARLGGLRNFLMRSFVDDDGVPLDAELIAFVEAEEDGEGGEETKSGELVPVSEISSTRGRDVRWRVHHPVDGDQLFPSESLARQYADEHGSSLRRLIYVMDSPYLVVEQSALEEIVNVIVEAAADRPTEPSSASSRSRPRKAR